MLLARRRPTVAPSLCAVAFAVIADRARESGSPRGENQDSAKIHPPSAECENFQSGTTALRRSPITARCLPGSPHLRCSGSSPTFDPPIDQGGPKHFCPFMGLALHAMGKRGHRAAKHLENYENFTRMLHPVIQGNLLWVTINVQADCLVPFMHLCN
jgi:hypothetical protein